MSQRNPMNDRYTTDEHQGKTRKSAAAMKPKTKAAASVRVQPTVKTKQQKKAEQKAQRAKQSELDRKYYNRPPRIQTAAQDVVGRLIGAIVCVALSWVARSWQPEWISYVALGLSYVLIIAAFYIDFSKIRKVRRAYQDEMMAKKSKEMRAAEKQQKAAQRQAAAQKEEAPAEEQPKKRGCSAAGFRLPGGKSKNEAATDAAPEAAPAGESNTAFERGKANAKAAADAAAKASGVQGKK